jgi:hypothetical protein
MYARLGAWAITTGEDVSEEEPEVGQSKKEGRQCKAALRPRRQGARDRPDGCASLRVDEGQNGKTKEV